MATGNQSVDARAATGERMCTLLEQVLMEIVGLHDMVKEIVDRQPSGGERGASSVKVTKTSAGASYEVKAYTGSDIAPAEHEALEAYWRIGKRLIAGPDQPHADSAGSRPQQRD